MRIESKLCHISENKAVVQVNGWLNDINLGSALAEASTVEQAEDKAILRLNKRLNPPYKEESNLNLKVDKQIKPVFNVELPKRDKLETNTVNDEPSDWSDELLAIDKEINRLNWTREEEILFLKQNFGHNNRNKITKYTELVNYLNSLKQIDNNISTKLNSNNINKIIEESDIILRDLSWNNQQGREFLQKEFNVSTRKELDEKQLLTFVEKLKFIKNQNKTN